MDKYMTRRRRALWIMLPCVVAGLLLYAVNEPRSPAADLGLFMVLMWLPGLAWFTFFFARKRAPIRPLMAWVDSTIQPEITVRITPLPQALNSVIRRSADCEYRGIFLLGTEGFSARFRVAAEGIDLTNGTVVQAQFLAPGKALPKFVKGTAFRLLEGRTVVADGEVIDTLAGASRS